MELETAKEMQAILNQYRLDTENVNAASTGLVAPPPAGLTAALWNAVVTTGAAHSAAVASYRAAASAAYATYESTVTPLNEQIEQLRSARIDLEILQFLREEEVRMQCITDLNELPQ